MDKKLLVAIVFQFIFCGVIFSQISESYFIDTEKKSGGSIGKIKYNDHFIISSRLFDQKKYVYSISMMDTLGNKVWSINLSDTTSNPVNYFSNGKIILMDNYIYASYINPQTNLSEINKIDASNGQKIWTKAYEFKFRSSKILNYDDEKFFIFYETTDQPFTQKYSFFNKSSGEIISTHFSLYPHGMDNDVAIDNDKNIYYSVSSNVFKVSHLNPDSIIWSKHFGDIGILDFNKIYIDDDNKVFVLTTISVGDPFKRGRVMRLNTDSGNFIWMSNVSAPTAGVRFRSLIDNDGHLVTIWPIKLHDSSGWLIAKINKENGDIKWKTNHKFTKNGELVDSTQPSSLIADINNNIYVTGSFSDKESFDGCWGILKLNGSDGQPIFEKAVINEEIETQHSSAGHSISIINNKLYLLGKLLGLYPALNDCGSCEESYNTFVKMDPDSGEILLKKNLGGSYQFPSETIKILKYGSEKTAVLKQVGRIVQVEMYDNNNDLIWQKPICKEYFLHGKNLTISENGELIITAYSSVEDNNYPYYSNKTHTIYTFILDENGNHVEDISINFDQENIVQVASIYDANYGTFIFYSLDDKLFYQNYHNGSLSNSVYLDIKYLDLSTQIKNVINNSETTILIFGKSISNNLNKVVELNKTNQQLTILDNSLTYINKINYVTKLSAENVIISGKAGNNKDIVINYNISIKDFIWKKNYDFLSEINKTILDNDSSNIYTIGSANNIPVVRKIASNNGSNLWSYSPTHNLPQKNIILKDIAFNNQSLDITITGYSVLASDTSDNSELYVEMIDTSGNSIENILNISGDDGVNRGNTVSSINNGEIWVGGKINKDSNPNSGFIFSFNNNTTSSPPSAPTNFTATFVSDNQIDLSWDDVSDETNYVIERSVDNNNSFSIINSPEANSTSYSDNTTNAGNTYFYRIKANNDAGSSPFSNLDSATTSCGTPSNLNTSNITDNNVNLSWNAIPGANSYQVQYRVAGNNDSAIQINFNTNSGFISGLFSGTNYEIRVKAICTNNSLFSDFSAFLNFSTTGEVICNPPLNITISNITNNSIDINWAAATNASSYIIQYRLKGIPSSAIRINNPTAETTISNLNAGTDYEIRVKTICLEDSIFSAYSDFQSFTTTGTVACNIPTNITISNITDNNMDLNWDAITSATSYQIQYRIFGIPSSAVYTNANTNSVNITGLNAGTNYEIRVKSICDNGNQYSQFSTFKPFTTTGTETCNDPTNVSISNITDNSADLTWDAMTGASSYQIQYRISGIPESKINTISNTNTQAISGLYPGTKYDIRVKTICNNGQQYSDFSNFQFFTTTGTETCNFPTNIVISSIADNSIDVNWDAMSGATRYKIQYRIIGIPGSAVNLTSNTNSQSISGLYPGTKYEIRIKTLCDNGNQYSEFSGFQEFTTTGTVTCNFPTNFTTSNITDSSVDLNWDTMAGATTYQIQYRIVGVPRSTIYSTSNTNSQVISGLFSGTKYEIRIKTLCDNGNQYSNFSSFLTFTTSGAIACDIPSNISITGITTSEATVNWDAVTGADTYQIQYREYGNPSTNTYTTSSTTSSIISGLSSATNYEIRVKTICTEGQLYSTYSSFNAFSTSASVSKTKSNIIENTEDQQPLNIFPNPSNNEVIVSMQNKNNHIIRMAVYNVIGSLVYQFQTSENLKETLELKQYGTGLYFFRIVYDGKIINKKVIIK